MHKAITHRIIRDVRRLSKEAEHGESKQQKQIERLKKKLKHK